MEINQILAAPDTGGSNAFAYYIGGNSTPTIAAGPLADAMMTALDQLYKKEIDPSTGVALESQQLDQARKEALFVTRKRIAQQLGLNEGASVLYGLNAVNAAPSDLINVAQAAGDMSPTERSDSVVIVEGAMDQTNPVVTALEELCQNQGMRYFKSFSEFLRSTR